MAQAERIADLQPSAAMSDRAAPERRANRLMLGTDFDGPTCGEHGALLNPMHAATTGMNELMYEWMGLTAEEIQLDSKKPQKGLFMAVGWHASPAHALIYSMSKYCAMHSDKGYRVGQKYVGYVEYTKARLLGADGAEAAARLDSLELIGRADDLLSIKGSRAYVSAINAPVIDRLLQPVEGSFLRYLEENKALAKGKDQSKIAVQIIAGAHSPEIIACVRAEAILGDFYMWPMLRAIKHRLPDGSDRHILDIGPVYQEAYKNLKYYAEFPRLVVSGEATLLPSFAYAYLEHGPGIKSKGKRAYADMKRIYAAAGNCDKILTLITAALEKIAATLHSHTSELQCGGRFAGENVTRELRAQYSGVNVTNTVVERAFGLEKFLHTRERGSHPRGRRGWVLFKYNRTHLWGRQLTPDKLRLYMRVAREEGAAMAKREGSKRQQLARNFEVCGVEREKLLEKVAEKAAEKAAEIARLRDPSLRVVTFSGLTKLQWVCLKEQLRLRSVVDKRCEDNGKALVLVPPKGEGGRAWYVRKLQALLKMEFAENKIENDPDDLEEGDLGLESRAPRAPRQSRAQMAAPSDGDEAAASKPKQRRGRKRKRTALSQPEDEDGEPEDEDDEHWAVDELLGRKVQSEEDFKYDSRFPPGTVLYLVAWEAHGEDENSWEPRENISSDLIRDYERQILESEAADSEGEPEDDDGDDEFMGVDVDASEVEQVLPVRILKHKYYYDPTGNGGLFCVWVKLKYSDGSTTPGFVSSTFLGDSEEGLALL